MSEEKNELIHDEMSKLIIRTVEEMVTQNGAAGINVRKVLQKLNISNRVFYNRFHNIDEVLAIVYKSTIIKVRESTTSSFDPEKDFFEQVMDMVTNSLIASYDAKMRFNQYVFENDSRNSGNYEWWVDEIKKLISYAGSRELIKEVDADILSYSIWCFCRGFNADAVARNLPRDEAVRRFRYSFAFLLEGLKL